MKPASHCVLPFLPHPANNPPKIVYARMGQKIIIRLPNWLGDAVMASPAVWDYITKHRDDKIVLFGLPLTVSVFQHSPYTNIELMVYDRDGIHQGFGGMVSIAARLQKQRYDRGYLLTRSFSSALLFRLGNVYQRTAYPQGFNRLFLHHTKKPPQEAVHQSQRYYYLLNGEVPHSLPPKIYLSDNEKTRAQQFIDTNRIDPSKPIIGMAVGAAFGTAKRWLPERYAEVGRWCVEEFGAMVLLFGSKKEFDVVNEVHKAIGKKSIALAGGTSLRDAFALAKRCDVMLCNDSGMMHTASAVGTQVIAMIGPTNPTDTAPLGKGHTLINKRVDCAPCLKRECPLGHHKCMTEIGVDEVKDTVVKMLERLNAVTSDE